jgi:hypothetical protein
MTLPEPLKRMLGLSSNGNKKIVATVPPPQRPPAPAEAKSDWICIDAKDAYPTNLALAVLRRNDKPTKAKEVVAGVTSIRPDVRRGSVNNLGTRLDKKAISRTKAGWTLINPETAPILENGLIWGPPAIFNKQELAAHRREAVLHLIQTFRTGLLTSQIIEQLENCPWVHAPLSKELVQDDVEFWFEAGRIKRSGNSKKWVLKPE